MRAPAGTGALDDQSPAMPVTSMRYGAVVLQG